MATSIQVSRTLQAKLKVLKERTKAKTYEEVLLRLLEHKDRSPRERFGSHPDMRPFAHRDEAHEP